MTTLRRAFALMEILADQASGVSFNQLRREFDNVAPATMSRLLQALVDDGYVAHEEPHGRYVLGDRFLGLSRRSLGIQSRRDIVQPELNRLAAATDESAVYFDLDGDGMVLLAKAEVEDGYHYMEINARWGPLAQDPFGWVCLPDFRQPDATAARMLREQGVVAKRKELKRFQAMRIVAPVHAQPAGDAVGSVGVTATTSEIASLELNTLCAEVKRSAQTLSQRIVN